ncbi:caspase family protein [Rhizobium leguminosarum]|uniref:caspase family protein n=1 Tax=Rhizobium leguminosarum TaxID=384 RepID=UPI00041562B4|nr:caspase family protein [Rhizobium leguminosarum]
MEDYEDPAYGTSDLRLKYAAKDAHSFASYAEVAWSNVEAATIVPLLDRGATLGSFDDAVSKFPPGSVDLFVLYLAGHGDQVAGRGAWFCLSDARPGQPNLTVAIIDEAVKRIAAPRTVLLLDCCYAGAVVAGSTFFSTLGPATSRLFLCSSRDDQRSWEDDDVRHGIFSNVLMNGLSSAGGLADARGMVDLEGSLFPYLCDQVPRVVFSKKARERQEPAKGGVSAGTILFPTTAAKVLGRQISTYQALRAGFWRLLQRSTLALVVVFLVLDLSFYHFWIGPTGTIEVRSGLAFMDPVRRTLPGGIIETPFNRSQLDLETRDDGKRNEVIRFAQGQHWGFSIHASDGWLGRLLPVLAEGDRRIAVALAAEETTGVSAESRPTAPVSAEAGPDSVVSAILRGDILRPTTFVPAEADLSAAGQLDCNANVRNTIDFTLFEPSSSVIEDDLRYATAKWAAADDGAAFESLLTAAKLISYRKLFAAKGSAEGATVDRELTALTRAAASLVLRPGAPAFATVLRTLTGTWCNYSSGLLLAVLGNAKERQDEAERLAHIVLKFDLQTQGDLLTDEQEQALNSLDAIAAAYPLPNLLVEDVVDILQKDSRGIDGNPQIVDWLRRIAERQQLSPKVVDFLHREFVKPAGEFDFNQLTSFAILARNVEGLPPSVRKELSDWSERHVEFATIGDFAEAVGRLAAVAHFDDKLVAAFAARLAPEIPFPLQSRPTGDRGETVITSDDFKQGVALGRIGQTQELPRPIVEKLARFAVARRGIPEFDQVLLGLAHQAGFSGDPSQIRQRLAANRSDALGRALDIELVSEYAQRLDAQPRRATLDSLHSAWANESAPEVKLSLGEILVNVRLSELGLRLVDPSNCTCQDRGWRIAVDE